MLFVLRKVVRNIKAEVLSLLSFTALNLLHANRGLSLPSDKTSEPRWKAFDYPQKDYPNTASDILVLTSIYRPTKRILLSCVSCIPIHNANIQKNVGKLKKKTFKVLLIWSLLLMTIF